VADALALQLGDCDPEPRYGDRDDGGPTLLGAWLGRSGRSTLATLRHAVGEPVEADLEPSALWLFGQPAPSQPGVAQEEPSSGWMRDCGHVVFRAGASTLTFDVGALGFGRLAAHGHADALHVTVSHAGALLVGDPGTGSYFGNDAVRGSFRGTPFHATVTVDGLDQAESLGPFLWGHPPVISDVEVDLERRNATASHDGYRRLADPVEHRRTIAMPEEGLLLIRDLLESDGAHTYSQRWPLPPGATVEAVSPDEFRVKIDEQTLLIRTACSAPCEASIREGALDPLEGWWSDGLESIRPAPLLRYDARDVRRAEFTTVLAFGEAPSLPESGAAHDLIGRTS
jgi:hypothetical protein